MLLPLEYRWLLAHGFSGFTPWYVIEDEKQREALVRAFGHETGMRGWPFARRQDRDDVAFLELAGEEPTGRVLSRHITWSGKREPGTGMVYAGMCEWLARQVIPDTREWMTEEDLQDVLDERS